MNTAIEIGLCCDLDKVAMARDAGFDFVETNVQKLLKGELDDDQWAAQLPDLDNLPLPMHTANGLIGGDHKIIGPKRDLDWLETYMGRVSKRAGQLGIKHVVFGSGGPRRKPDDMSESAAFEQLVEFATMLGDVAAPYDVTFVVEHLNKKETNTLNSLADEQRLIDRVGHPNVQALIDTYHYGVENETEDAVIAMGSRIAHVHLAEPNGRGEPGAVTEGQEPFDFVDFFTNLIKVGYDGRLSIEARWSGDIADKAPQVVALLREQWAQAAAGQ